MNGLRRRARRYRLIRLALWAVRVLLLLVGLGFVLAVLIRSH